MTLNEIIKKYSEDWEEENFEGWKTTQIMYCKLDWVIQEIAEIGNDDFDEHIGVLASIQSFIEDLQKLEKK
jgi:hypothetical protein